MIVCSMELTTVLIISFLIISSVGTLLHFTHNWIKRGFLLHLFSALNESTWEHMKLLLLPTLLASVFQIFVFKGRYGNMNSAILVLLLVELLAMPLIFEPLRVVFKKVHFGITIGIFFVSIALGLLAEYYILINNIIVFNEVVAGILIYIVVILFGIFTFFPPKFFLFKDPVTGRYGDIS